MRMVRRFWNKYGKPYQLLKVCGEVTPKPWALAALIGSQPVIMLRKSIPRVLVVVLGVTLGLLVGIAKGVGLTARAVPWLNRFRTFHSNPRRMASFVLLIAKE